MLCERKLKKRRGYLQTINNLLKHNDQIAIARMLNNSQPHVCKVFSGETSSKPVLKAAIKFLLDNQRIDNQAAEDLIKQIEAV